MWARSATRLSHTRVKKEEKRKKNHISLRSFFFLPQMSSRHSTPRILPIDCVQPMDRSLQIHIAV